MDLSVLLDPLDLPRLVEILDELGHLGRLDTVRGWDGATMATLYEAIQGFKPVTLDDFVPPNVPPLTEVIHHGKSSLTGFTHFQMRFCKPAPESSASGGELWGYNAPPPLVLGFAGAGYCVAREGGAGEIAVDYTRIPQGKVTTWPDDVKTNERGLGPRAIYGRRIDVLRGLSRQVSLGRAKRVKPRGKPESAAWVDTWFVLCREDADAA
jgi:hypothetical protein